MKRNSQTFVLWITAGSALSFSNCFKRMRYKEVRGKKIAALKVHLIFHLFNQSRALLCGNRRVEATGREEKFVRNVFEKSLQIKEKKEKANEEEMIDRNWALRFLGLLLRWLLRLLLLHRNSFLPQKPITHTPLLPSLLH